MTPETTNENNTDKKQACFIPIISNAKELEEQFERGLINYNELKERLSIKFGESKTINAEDIGT